MPQVATHKKSWEPNTARVTLPEHRPPRGQGASHSGPGPEERELLAAAPELAAYIADLKKRGHGHGTLALRRLLRMLRDYPRAAFLAATSSAACYGLYDLDRLERLVLWNVARDFFPNPGGDPRERPDDEDPPDER